MKKSITLFLFFILVGTASAQTPITGTWEGGIDIQGQKLGVVFHFEGEAGNYSGTLDIPMQGATDLQLIYVVVNEDSLSTAFNAGPNLGEFSGSIQPEIIEGTYSQGGASFPFEIQKQDSSSEIPNTAGVGQDLIIQNGDVIIGGTLVTPDWPTQPPIVIMLSGSGAQNRDSEVAGFKPFAQIADYLKSQNIASFRFDDRQVGESTGSFSDANLETLSSDVEAIIQYLQSSITRTFVEIILLGHSQGGIVAGKVARENPEVDQLILMASPSVTMEEILRFQVQQAYEEFDLPENVIEQEISARENLMVAIKKSEELEEARQEYRTRYEQVLSSLSEEQQAAIPQDRDSFINRQMNQLVAFYSTPQMQSLLFHDPAENLSDLNIPVLVLFGGKDTQVASSVNLEPVEDALEKSDAEFQVTTIEDANHLFQKAETGNVSEYTSLDKSFTEGFLETISEWISSHND